MHRPILRILALVLLLVQAGASLLRGQSLCIGLDGHHGAHLHAALDGFQLHRHARSHPHECCADHGREGGSTSPRVDAVHPRDGAGGCPQVHHHLHLQMPEVEPEGRGGATMVPNFSGLPGLAMLAPTAGTGVLSASLVLTGDLAWSCCDARRGLSATCLRL